MYVDAKSIDIYVRQSIIWTDSTIRERTYTKHCCWEPVQISGMLGMCVWHEAQRELGRWLVGGKLRR